MDKLVLDTDILIDHVHGHARWLDEILTTQKTRCIVPTVVVAEYHSAQELETSIGLATSRAYLQTFTVADFTEPIAETLGTILRRKAYPAGAGTADLIIASTAIYLGAPLATRNATHFLGIAGLRLFDPKKLAQ